MAAWTRISVSLSVLRNSSRSSRVSHQQSRKQVSIWHPSCSTTSRRYQMKRVARLLLATCIVPALVYAQALAYDYSRLYEASSPAVVQVTTQDGSGSGFLVTPAGHIATNFHVVRGSKYLAVQFPDGRKVKATVVAVNPHYDMALLKVNSEVVAGITPLAVLPEEKDSTIKVGVPVVAIGSPLNQKFLMTQGKIGRASCRERV